MRIASHEALRTIKCNEKLKLFPAAICRAVLNEAQPSLW
jgi:hypothetical protein